MLNTQVSEATPLKAAIAKVLAKDATTSPETEAERLVRERVTGERSNSYWCVERLGSDSLFHQRGVLGAMLHARQSERLLCFTQAHRGVCFVLVLRGVPSKLARLLLGALPGLRALAGQEAVHHSALVHAGTTRPRRRLRRGLRRCQWRQRAGTWAPWSRSARGAPLGSPSMLCQGQGCMGMCPSSAMESLLQWQLYISHGIMASVAPSLQMTLLQHRGAPPSSCRLPPAAVPVFLLIVVRQLGRPDMLCRRWHPV